MKTTVVEDARWKSEQRLRAIIDNLSEGLVIASTDGQLLHWNNASRAMFGFRSVEEGLRNLPEFADTFELSTLEGRVLEVEEWPLSRVIAGEHLDDLELRLKRHGIDGPFILSFSGAIVGDGQEESLAFLSFSDITERRRAEEALRESEEQFRSMVDAISQLAWIAQADGDISWYNQRWFEYTGTTPDEMQGWGWQRVHDPEMLPKVVEGWKASIATGEPFEMDFPLRAADGSYRWFLTRAFPVKDAAGRVLRWCGTNTDITDHKAAEEAIHTLNVDLERRVAERTAQLKASLAEKEVLLQEIHHRVKNNLQVVCGLLQLQAGQTEDPATRALFKESEGRVKSMALVHQALYQSDLANIDFGRYADKLTSTLFRSYNVDPSRITLRLEARGVKVSADVAVPCGLIINELVTNALKYAFPNDRRGEVRVALGQNRDGSLALSVTDNGIGFPSGLDFKHGTTLGLRLVANLAAQLSGVTEHGNDGGAFWKTIFRPAP